MSERVNERIDERMDERVNERMDERVNEYVDQAEKMLLKIYELDDETLENTTCKEDDITNVVDLLTVYEEISYLDNIIRNMETSEYIATKEDAAALFVKEGEILNLRLMHSCRYALILNHALTACETIVHLMKRN